MSDVRETGTPQEPVMKSIEPELAEALKNRHIGSKPKERELPRILQTRRAELGQVVQFERPEREVIPGLTPPSGTVTLPSKGLLYDGKLPDGNVEVAAITGREEKLIAGATGDVSELIDGLLNRLMLTRSVRPGELLLTDRLFILFNIRANSYGPRYGWQVTCRGCRRLFRHELKIPGDLEIIELPDGAAEPFEVALPVSGAKIGFRLLRGEDEMEVTRYLDAQVKKGRVGPQWGDHAYTFRMALQLIEFTPGGYNQEKLAEEAQKLTDLGEIKEYDLDEAMLFSDVRMRCWEPTPGAPVDTFPHRGKGDIEKRLAIIEGLIGSDIYAFREAAEEFDSGMRLVTDVQCPTCQTWMREESVPLSAEFFRPAQRESRRSSRATVSTD